MLEVQIENILPVTEARDKLNQLVDEVQSSDNMYVMTKNGKPAAILVGVHHLEKLTGQKHENIFGNNNNSKEMEDNLDNPMDTRPVKSDDTAASAATPVDDTQASANDMTPVVSDTQSAMKETDAPVIPDTTAIIEPDPMSSIAPAPNEPVVPAAPVPPAMGAPVSATPAAPAVGEEEKSVDQDAAPTPPTPGV